MSDQTENPNVQTAEAPPVTEPAPPERTGFGRRLGAYLLDVVFTIILGGLIGYILKDALAGLVPQQPADVPPEAGAMMAGITVGVVVAGALYGLIEAFTAASPGKMILAIKIGQDNAHPAPGGTLFARYAFKYSSQILSTIGLIIGIQTLSMIGNLAGLVVFIGCFFALGQTRQALHDRLFHTAVYPESDV